MNEWKNCYLSKIAYVIFSAYRKNFLQIYTKNKKKIKLNQNISEGL